jgi:hypothetical protein
VPEQPGERRQDDADQTEEQKLPETLQASASGRPVHGKRAEHAGSHDKGRRDRLAGEDQEHERQGDACQGRVKNEQRKRLL